MKKSKNVNFYVLDAPYHTMESAVELGIIAKKIHCYRFDLQSGQEMSS